MSISFEDGEATRAPLFGTIFTSPSFASLRSASRTGVRLTPISFAILTSRSLCAGFSSRLRIFPRSSMYTESDEVLYIRCSIIKTSP